jgi:hypothetical protein
VVNQEKRLHPFGPPPTLSNFSEIVGPCLTRSLLKIPISFHIRIPGLLLREIHGGIETWLKKVFLGFGFGPKIFTIVFYVTVRGPEAP